VIISIEKKVQPPKDKEKQKLFFLEVDGRGEDPPPDSISLWLFS
jgi:hypothetical protein